MPDSAPEDVWKKWKDTGDDAHLKQLRGMFAPYSGRVASIYKRQGVRLPDPVIDSITQDVMLKALKRYDPRYGKLRPWVSSYLQKVKSTVAAKQNLVRIPETRVFDIGKFKRTVGELEAKKKRVKTKDIAKQLGWPEAKVLKMERELGSSTLGSAVPFATKQVTDPAEDAFQMLGPSLSKQDKQVYNLIRGGTTGTRDISKDVGISEPEVSRAKSRIFAGVTDAPK
jgi:DNA-directed RNA polymerase specialized sigma subunit